MFRLISNLPNGFENYLELLRESNFTSPVFKKNKIARNFPQQGKCSFSEHLKLWKIDLKNFAFCMTTGLSGKNEPWSEVSVVQTILTKLTKKPAFA
jgi:hypothetical protein